MNLDRDGGGWVGEREGGGVGYTGRGVFLFRARFACGGNGAVGSTPGPARSLGILNDEINALTLGTLNGETNALTLGEGLVHFVQGTERRLRGVLWAGWREPFEAPHANTHAPRLSRPPRPLPTALHWRWCREIRGGGRGGGSDLT